MQHIKIEPYKTYDSDEILALYGAVGWTAYTEQPEMLRQAFAHSLLTLAACDGDKLVGIIRAVGDGYSMVYVQDILILPGYQRRGIGTALMKEMLSRYEHVYQKALMTDNTPKTIAFYRSLGFTQVTDWGCTAFMKND